MSSVNRRSAAASMLITVVAVFVVAGTSATAQSEPEPIDAATRCTPQSTGGVSRITVAALPGSVAAVDVLQAAPECVLSIEAIDGLGTASLERFLGRLGVDRLHVMADGGEDMLTLDGSPVSGPLDDALKVEEIRFGSGAITRDGVQDVVRLFQRGRLDDLNPVLGGAPADIFERGRYQVVILDTAGDPTVPSDIVRTWEIGLAGKDPARNVPSVGGAGNPFSGVQHVLTYAQVPTEGGGFEGRLGHTNFGSDKLGPDGQTRFYNGRTNFGALAYSDGVAFVFPEDLGPVGLRAWTRGGDPVVWDIVQGPGGPMALIPPDGSWAGMLGLFQPIVVHEPITLPATVNGQVMPTVEFPSQLALLLGVPLVDPGEPLTIDLGYLTGDTSVRFDDLIAQPLGGGLFGTRVGLTTYGPHAFDHLAIDQLGAMPEEWSLVSEEARMLGWSPFLIDEAEGPIHGHLVQPWFLGIGDATRQPFDPVLAAQMLDEAGWPRPETP